MLSLMSSDWPMGVEVRSDTWIHNIYCLILILRLTGIDNLVWVREVIWIGRFFRVERQIFKILLLLILEPSNKPFLLFRSVFRGSLLSTTFFSSETWGVGMIAILLSGVGYIFSYAWRTAFSGSRPQGYLQREPFEPSLFFKYLLFQTLQRHCQLPVQFHW